VCRNVTEFIAGTGKLITKEVGVRLVNVKVIYSQTAVLLHTLFFMLSWLRSVEM